MRYLPTGEQMQRADTFTIKNVGIPSLVLMERAALQTVETMEAHHISLTHTLLVCGPGNNGGDGLAIARLLHERGYCVTVAFVGKEESCSQECHVQLEILKRIGVSVGNRIKCQEYSSIIDAVFGVGLHREIAGEYKVIIEKMNELSGQKIAVDIPSGVCSETGAVLGCAFRADMTVSFACEKLGTVFYPGAEYAGKVFCVPIGISNSPLLAEANICYTYEKKDLARLLPKRPADSHKGTYGTALMIVGSRQMSGAAYLSAKAAYMSGAGLVHIYTARENQTALQQLLPEAVITCYTQFDKVQLRDLLDQADVVAIGSGMGQSSTAEQLLTETLKVVNKPCVIDADGLNLLSRHLDFLAGKKSPVILTPHMKEMSRLLGCSVSELKERRFELLDEFAEQFGAVSVLKDTRTVVFQKNGERFVNTSGNQSMAKAGSGDVLTGIITGFLAQGSTPNEGAALGVYVHGLAGDLAREKKGKYSVLASDLIDEIANVLERGDRK